jgi:hypothetical protein
LGDNLWIKSVAGEQDVERLAAFNASVHQDAAVGVLTRWWLSGMHPGMSTDDFLFVEDAKTGQIVSALCLLEQTWTYEDVPLRAGLVELVGTHPDYRGRGLVRAQMALIERMLKAKDCALSCIAGIPHFYRHFGYEYAIPLGSCAKLPLDRVPALGEGRQESVHIRRMMVDADLPTVMELYDAYAAELDIAPVRDETLWRFQESAPAGIPEPSETYAVEDHSGVVGYIRVRKNMWGPLLEFAEASLRPGGNPWGSQEALLAVLRFGRELAQQRNYSQLCFALPTAHPLVTVAGYLGAASERQYAWQVCIVDHADFMWRIAPVLEKRLAHSLLAGLTGSLDVNMMPRLVRLQFEQGHLVAIAHVEAPRRDMVLRMPPMLLTQLVLGYRSCAEIMESHLDAAVGARARQLADVLFPKTDAFIYSAI